MKRFLALIALSVLVVCVMGADGDSNYTNLVASGDVTAGDDITAGDDLNAAQITGGETIILPFYMDSPASPEVVSMAAPADGTIRRVDYVLRSGTATVVLRNDTDGDNLATLSLTTTSATTTTISSAEEVDAEDLIKLTVTADSSAAEGLVWVYLVTSSAVSPEG